MKKLNSKEMRAINGGKHFYCYQCRYYGWDTNLGACSFWHMITTGHTHMRVNMP